MVVGDDVGVSEARQDLELGVQLFTLLLRHLEVADLLPAHDQSIGLPSHPSDNSKGAMACERDHGLAFKVSAPMRGWVAASDAMCGMHFGRGLPIFSKTSNLSDSVIVRNSLLLFAAAGRL